MRRACKQSAVSDFNKIEFLSRTGLSEMLFHLYTHIRTQTHTLPAQYHGKATKNKTMCIMFMCVDTNCPFVVGVSAISNDYQCTSAGSMIFIVIPTHIFARVEAKL